MDKQFNVLNEVGDYGLYHPLNEEENKRANHTTFSRKPNPKAQKSENIDPNSIRLGDCSHLSCRK